MVSKNRISEIMSDNPHSEAVEILFELFDEDIARRKKVFQDEINRLKQQHAEEIEKLEDENYELFSEVEAYKIMEKTNGYSELVHETFVQERKIKKLKKEIQQLYMKIQKFAMSACAPATETAELMDKWENKTGMTYVELPSSYCPVCGSQKRAICAQCGVNPVEDDEVVNLCKKCIKILTKEALDYVSDVESGEG